MAEPVLAAVILDSVKAIRDLGNVMDLVRQNLLSFHGIAEDRENRNHIKACSDLLGTLVEFKESPSAFLYEIEAAGGKDLDQLTDEELRNSDIIGRISFDATAFSSRLSEVIEHQKEVFSKGWIQGGDAFLDLREALNKRQYLLNQLQALDATELDPEAVRTVASAYKVLAAQLNELLEALRQYVAKQQAERP